MLSTPLPHWLHHCPPPTYSPYPDSAELCVRHVSPVCPGLQGCKEAARRNSQLGFINIFFMVLSTKGCPLHLLLWPQFLTWCLLPAPLLLLPMQPTQGTPRHLPKVKVMARLFFFKYSHSSHLTIFYCRIDYYSPAKKHKDLDAGFLPSNIFAVLEQAVGTACSCQ